MCCSAVKNKAVYFRLTDLRRSKWQYVFLLIGFTIIAENAFLLCIQNEHKSNVDGTR